MTCFTIATKHLEEANNKNSLKVDFLCGLFKKENNKKNICYLHHPSNDFSELVQGHKAGKAEAL